MTPNETQGAKGFYKLSWLQRIGFGSGDLAQNLIFQVICTYLLFFYTDIYGLTPSAVAVMFLVGNVANVIWDPIVGTLIDKSNPRFGKYRSYLLYVGIPLSGFAILCFYNGFAPSLIYAYVTYVSMQLLYTFINVPYGALNSSLTRDTNEITSGRELWSASVHRPDCRCTVRQSSQRSLGLVYHDDNLCHRRFLSAAVLLHTM